MHRIVTTLMLELFVNAFAVAAPAIAKQTELTPAKTVAERLGYRADTRLLIIEAQDLGMARSIDKATFEALERGWVTSAGILVPAPWFPEVIRWKASHPHADLGIELDMTSEWVSYRWRAVSTQQNGSTLLDSAGYLPLTEMYIARHTKPDDIEIEARAQMDLANKAGIVPTHLDTHMHVFMMAPSLFRIYWNIGIEDKIPVLLANARVKARGIANQDGQSYNFGGVTISPLQTPVDRIIEMMPGVSRQDWISAYKKALEGLPPGVYVLCVHLGLEDEELDAMTWNHPKWGSQWRQNDFDTIRSLDFQQFLKHEGFILTNWREINKAIY